MHSAVNKAEFLDALTWKGGEEEMGRNISKLFYDAIANEDWKTSEDYDDDDDDDDDDHKND